MVTIWDTGIHCIRYNALANTWEGVASIWRVLFAIKALLSLVTVSSLGQISRNSKYNICIDVMTNRQTKISSDKIPVNKMIDNIFEAVT